MPPACSVHTPTSIEEAVAALGNGGAVAFAGATWLLRARLRGEALAGGFVALRDIAELGALEIGRDEICIGAAVTHAKLAEALRGLPEFAGLVRAAAEAANPAVRRAATLGGNLCAVGFAASDLTPALLAASAEVEICSAGGARRLSLEAFLAERARLPPGWLLTRIYAPRADRLTAHARLPLRKAGDYPVAIVSASLARSADGRVASARIAVGSVEPTARRWLALERALIGRQAEADEAAELARPLTDEFTGRDGIEAPGWYRTQVLPSLVRTAFHSLQART
jgi:carbon-monoxide dehydrogenase medium subunit